MEALHIEKHETVCDLCGSSIALTKRQLGERTRGYAVIMDGKHIVSSRIQPHQEEKT